jgi:Na+/melibiose symporter-like transporter
MTLVAETIGQDRVGHLFGYRQGATSVFKLISAGACVWLLSIYAFPNNYVILYFAALVSVMISWFVFGLVNEVPRDSVPAKPKKIGPYFRELFSSIKGNRDFRWLLVYRAVNRLGFAAMPFYAFAARSVFKAPDSYAGWFMGATAVAQIIGCFSLPHLGGWLGHKRMLGLGSLLHVTAMLMAAFAPSLNWFFPVLFFSGLGMASLTVSGAAFMLEMAPRKRRVGYFNMMMACMAPVGMAASVSAGIVMETFSHKWLFIVTAGIILLGLIPLERCNPQRGKIEDLEDNEALTDKKKETSNEAA